MLAFGGPLHGIDGWSCSLRVSTGTAVPTRAQEEASLAAAKTACINFVAGGSHIASVAQLAWVKLNRVNTEGHYERDYTNVVEVLPMQPGGYGGVRHAPQVALVATLLTGSKRGLASSGRIYVPSPGAAVGADGRISTSDAAVMQSAVTTLVQSINAIENLGDVMVGSRVGTGAARPVTGVVVGRTLDTMRSRRAQLPEQRGVLTAIAPAPAGTDF